MAALHSIRKQIMRLYLHQTSILQYFNIPCLPPSPHLGTYKQSGILIVREHDKKQASILLFDNRKEIHTLNFNKEVESESKSDIRIIMMKENEQNYN